MNTKCGLSVELQLETTIEEKRKVISLVNSHLFYLGRVFIVFEEESYRLVVYRKGKIVTDENYNKVQGAKIAFLKFFSFMALHKNTRAIWTFPYVPYQEWLENRLEGI